MWAFILHSRSRRELPPGRPGFTLVELLVAMSILILVAGLTVALLPRLQEKQRVQTGASQLQGWLMTAKQWALRDQAPRGLRFQADTNGQVRQIQYIEQPEDFYGGQIQVSGTTASLYVQYDSNNNPVYYYYNVDFAGNPPPPPTPVVPPADQWPVQAGDYLLFGGSSQVFRILSLPTPISLTLSAPAQSNTSIDPTSDYRIIRQARPRVGEAPLQLPDNIVIDLATNGPYNNLIPGYTFDIMFDPSGEVLGWGSSARIQLWLRDASEDLPNYPGAVKPMYNGQQILVTVNVRSGMITANPVDVTLDNAANPTQYAAPYSLTLDGRSSGM